jgi:hypothetical protein
MFASADDEIQADEYCGNFDRNPRASIPPHRNSLCSFLEAANPIECDGSDLSYGITVLEAIRNHNALNITYRLSFKIGISA